LRKSPIIRAIKELTWEIGLLLVDLSLFLCIVMENPGERKYAMEIRALWSPCELAGYLGLSYRTIMKYIHKGEIPSYYIHRRYYISKEELADYLREHRTRVVR